MYKALLILFLCLVSQIILAQKYNTGVKPEVSLTLVPPSPVTDQIILDVRAGIWNNTESEKRNTVVVYIDQVTNKNIVFSNEFVLAAKSTKGIRFQWSTINQVGEHKFILICKTIK